ncbi:MAG: hypothetical protein FWG68_06675, partial [Defluviitaleaceae bacterium]|nr:hypothetical protein [Defluviitaleaceae bacterium]
TKQDTNFEQAVNATRLFADVLGKNINLEKYFAENHANYGITTDRHRMLIIPQLFGLITKTPFYQCWFIMHNIKRNLYSINLICNLSNFHVIIKKTQMKR